MKTTASDVLIDSIHDWGVDVVFGLPRDGINGIMEAEQMVFLGNPEYGCELQPINFALFAQACGGTGMTVDDPRDCGRVIEQALNTPGPVVVEAVVDPYEPPMPPKVSVRQAEKLAESRKNSCDDRRRSNPGADLRTHASNH